MRCLCFTGYGTVFVFVGSQSRDLVTLLFYSNDVLVIITWRESGAAGDKTIVRGGPQLSAAQASNCTTLGPPANCCLISAWKQFTVMGVQTLD